MDGPRVIFAKDARIKAAIIVLRRGGDIREVSKHLAWQDFEGLVSMALEANGYDVQRNVRVKKPHIELDVVGLKDASAVAVDCKHWKRTVGGATIERIAAQQLRRAKGFVQMRKPRLRSIVPVVVTLHPEGLSFAHGVPIVPIHQFQSFLEQLPGLDQPIRVIPRRRGSTASKGLQPRLL